MRLQTAQREEIMQFPLNKAALLIALATLAPLPAPAQDLLPISIELGDVSPHRADGLVRLGRDYLLSRECPHAGAPVGV